MQLLQGSVACRAALLTVIVAFSIPSWTSRVVAQVCVAKSPFEYDEPERQGVNLQKLLEMTQWLRVSPIPLLSLTVSSNGKIVFELYSSRVERSDAHYVMSVTKSVTAALVGVAADRHLIKATDSSVTDNLPMAAFPNTETFNRFKTVTLKDVMGMSALDAQLWPHLKTPEAKNRSDSFMRSPNRLKFALEQATLPRVGKDFQYTDVTPIIAGAIVQLATHKTLLDFARQVLFDPMGFENEEWMHQDSAGYDNASYGLRLRPIDMQKFGILFLNNGCWSGEQLVSKSGWRPSSRPG
jgi:CubicO group peptidase (beta-lactamase class C family)